VNRYRVDVDIVDKEATMLEGGDTLVLAGLESYVQAVTKDAAVYATFDQLHDAGEMVCRVRSVTYLSEV
jgi:hypothetical protein